jgi:hypothetical protein
MSRGNIIAEGWISRSAYHVTFETRSGDRTYEYDSASGLAIAAGGDPHDYYGAEVGALNYADNLAEDLEDIGELAELAAF